MAFSKQLSRDKSRQSNHMWPSWRGPVQGPQYGTGAWLGAWNPSTILELSPFATSWTQSDTAYVAFVCLVALVLRLAWTTSDQEITETERSFLFQINHYFSHRFYVTRDSPVMQLALYYLGKWLTDYDGSLDSQTITEYPVDTLFPFKTFRVVNACLGTVAVAVTYRYLRVLCCTTSVSAFVGAWLVAIESSYVTEQRLISPCNGLFLAAVLALYSTKKEECMSEGPLTLQWLKRSISTACACGLAYIIDSQLGGAIVTFSVACSLYRYWWNNALFNSITALCGMILQSALYATTVILIFISTTMYHLHLTPLTGEGDQYVDGQFQAALNPELLMPIMANVSYQSIVSIRHLNTHGYLHSHKAFFPQGSQQQQVSLYAYRDANNYWFVERPINASKTEHLAKRETFSSSDKQLSSDPAQRPTQSATSLDPFSAYTQSLPYGDEDCRVQQKLGHPKRNSGNVDYIDEDGNHSEFDKKETEKLEEAFYGEFQPVTFGNSTVIRLQHAITKKFLHSHGVQAPISDAEWQQEVSAYGAMGYPGDLNDLWLVEVVKEASEPGDSVQRWQAISSIVRFRHVLSGCYLFSHRKRLPQWGFYQYEVTCAQQGIVENSLWYVESNLHPTPPQGKVSSVSYRTPSLAAKFIEYINAMAAYSQDTSSDEDGHIGGRPRNWDVLFPTAHVYGVFADHRQIVSLGNPIVWYAGLASILLYLGFKIVTLVCVQRGWRPSVRRQQAMLQFDHNEGRLVVAWMALYFAAANAPVEKQMSYSLALYVSILSFATTLDYFAKPHTRKFVSCAITLLCSCHFVAYSPLIYGTYWTSHNCQRAARLGDWPLQCQVYNTSVPLSFEPPGVFFDHLREVGAQQDSQQDLELGPNLVDADQTQKAASSKLSQEWSRITPPPLLAAVNLSDSVDSNTYN